MFNIGIAGSAWLGGALNQHHNYFPIFSKSFHRIITTISSSIPIIIKIGVPIATSLILTTPRTINPKALRINPTLRIINLNFVIIILL